MDEIADYYSITQPGFDADYYYGSDYEHSDAYFDYMEQEYGEYGYLEEEYETKYWTAYTSLDDGRTPRYITNTWEQRVLVGRKWVWDSNHYQKSISWDEGNNENANRPPRVSIYEEGSVSEQIIKWMIYINNNPKDEIYYSEMVNPILFNNQGYSEYRGFLTAKSAQEDVYGGVEYAITNPLTVNPNFPIMSVLPLLEAKSLKIVQCPTCGNCSGVQVITLSFVNNKSFIQAHSRIFK